MSVDDSAATTSAPARVTRVTQREGQSMIANVFCIYCCQILT
jgi:hypothetical protein